MGLHVDSCNRRLGTGGRKLYAVGGGPDQLSPCGGRSCGLGRGCGEPAAFGEADAGRDDMIFYYKSDCGIFRGIFFFLMRVWNPLPRRIKIVRDGKYVLDVRGRWISNKIQKRELARRRMAGEEEKKCFKVYPAGSIEMSGKAE